MAKKKKRNNKSNWSHEWTGLIIIALGVFAGCCIYARPLGIVGDSFANLVGALCGIISYAVPVLFVFVGVLCIAAKGKIVNAKKLIPSILLLVGLVGCIHLVPYNQIHITDDGFFSSMGSAITAGVSRKGAGIIGELLIFPCNALIEYVGSWILYVTLIVVCVVIITNFSIKKASNEIGTKVTTVIQEHSERREKARMYTYELEEPRQYEERPKKRRDRLVIEDFYGEEEDAEDDIPLRTLDAMPVQERKEPPRFSEPIPDKPVQISTPVERPQPKHVDYAQEPLPRTSATTDKNANTYVFPPVTLLSAPMERKGVRQENYREKAEILESTLASFGIEAHVINVSRGPAITRYELSIAKGVKVSRILALSDDIGYSMATSGVRIEAPIPGKSAIGIEIPNKDVTIVTLREVIDSDPFRNHSTNTCFGLGKDIAGTTIIADLHRMPHLLIAGATGSGKSVCINSLVVSLLYKATPEQVRMVMIDPKVVELSVYNGIPHLLMPVVTDAKKAAGALNAMVREMEQRYQKFAESDVRDITRFNEVAKSKGEPTLPRIIIIIDELADLMMVAADDVENSICRLAQLARAAGMYLVIATQRPSVNVITGVIKANLPSRISFAVSSSYDSKTILDMGGAEKLLGKGDMLYYPSGELKPMRVQGAYITDVEVQEVVEFVKKDKEPDYNEELIKNTQMELKESFSAEGSDVLFNDALRIVVECDQASISLLQRRLRVGHSRAGRLIDEMAERGYISSSEGSKPRNILISREQMEQIIAQEENGVGA